MIVGPDRGPRLGWPRSGFAAAFGLEQLQLRFFEESVVFQDAYGLQQVRLLVVAVYLGLIDQIAEHRSERDDRVDSFGAQEFDAAVAGGGVPRQRRHHEDFRQRPIVTEGPGGLAKNGRLDEAEDLRRVGQDRRAKGFGVPAFYDHHGARDGSEVGRTQNERRRLGPGGGAWIKDQQPDLLIFGPAAGDVLALLAHEEAVQLEILADDRFANGGHIRRPTAGREARICPRPARSSPAALSRPSGPFRFFQRARTGFHQP